MSPRPAASATSVHAALASPTRRRLMELLKAAGGARDVHDLGEAVSLHTSTVRFHLETLRRAGLVTRQPVTEPGFGRPRTAYAAAAPLGEPSGYADLARLLAANLARTTKDRASRAEAIGGQWAEQLLPDPTDPVRDLDEATMVVSGLFDRLGFASEPCTQGATKTLALHACPFRGVAREHPEVVCAVHLGLLRGSVARLGVPATAQLAPFVEPELCMVRIAPPEAATA